MNSKISLARRALPSRSLLRQRHRGRAARGHRLLRLELAERNLTNLHYLTRGHASLHPTQSYDVRSLPLVMTGQHLRSVNTCTAWLRQAMGLFPRQKLQ